MAEPQVVAEIGCNWRGNRALLLQAVDNTFYTGCKIVKFQIGLDTLYSRERAPKRWANTQSYAFPLDLLPDIRANATARGMQICASILDPELVPEVAPYIDIFKVASGDLTYEPMLEACGKAALAKGQGVHLLIATGAATCSEAINAVEFITERGVREYALMRCTSVYPASSKDARLKRFIGLFGKGILTFGYSDHTRTNISAITAVGAGYTWFEHHYDPWKMDMAASPDTCVSFDMIEMMEYVKEIREAHLCMGTLASPDYIPDEEPERSWARRDEDGLRPKGVKE